MLEVRHAIAAYWRARQITTKQQLIAAQTARLARWLRVDVPNVAYYQDRAVSALEDLPIVDKATIMADFAQFNTAGITKAEGWAAFDSTKQIGDLIVGASTGTSGNRGLFVISQAERFRWLGTILAKALPGFWRKRHKVAVLLPLNTPLYDSANRVQQLELQFFDLGKDWGADLCAFQPTVMIAPPKVLRLIATKYLSLKPDVVFAAAEALDPLDATIISAFFGKPLRQIYMASEGLFAVSCAQGSLHLCEDTMHFELPPFGDNPDLREVIISDFSRQTQIMARYRMNDLIRLGGACPCGLPHQTIAQVVGRADDCFVLQGKMITPDIVRNAVVDADRTITDFRILQTGADHIVVTVPQGCETDAVRAGMQSVLKQKSVHANIRVETGEMPVRMDRKLRRVENRFGKPEA